MIRSGPHWCLKLQTFNYLGEELEDIQSVRSFCETSDGNL